MPRTLGYHWVKSGYGLWLPGDDRGHWSSAWDEQIGFTEPGTLHAGDPVRLRMAQERMARPPVRLTREMMQVAAHAVGQCAAGSEWRIAAFSIEPTHMHALITHTSRDIYNTVKWLAQRITKAIHQQTPHTGPVWCESRWLSFIFDGDDHWSRAMSYIEAHNMRHGLPSRPYAFINP